MARGPSFRVTKIAPPQEPELAVVGYGTPAVSDAGISSFLWLAD